ncbi:MAG: type VII toxin-antitoxin system MntA family adenylyltransferase antitoxin [Bacillota bacterium]
MGKKRLSTKEKKALIERISDVLKEKKYIVFAYIFGSFVCEEDFNDIDIGIFILEPQKSPLSLELEMELELEEIVYMPVDVRIINHAPLPFIYHILKEGILIVDRNSLSRADFEGLVYKKYFDSQHLRREYLKEIINATI